MTEEERRQHTWIADDFGAMWWGPQWGGQADDPTKGFWDITRLSSTNVVGWYDTWDELLHDFPEFDQADQIS